MTFAYPSVVELIELINQSNKWLTNYKNNKSLLLYSFVYKALNKLYGLYNLNPCQTKTDKTSSV